MIRAALFDLDGVLRHFEVEALLEIERRHGLAPRAILTALLHPSRLQDAVTGRLSDEEWRNAAARELGPAGADFLAWEGIHGRVDEAVLGLIQNVRKKVPVGLLTNATSRLRADLCRLGLDDAFDLVVNTSEIGVAKPDARAFAHAAEGLGFSPAEILFVDDTAANVEAAARLGFTAHRFEGAEGLTAFLGDRGLL